MAEYLDHPAGFVDQRGRNADRRGFARAIGSQKRKKVAFLDFQVDGLERFDTVFVNFGELSED
jgi:hypothetical protein